MSAKEKCEDKKDESEECEETDGIQYSDNDINNFINKAKKIMLERYCELENGSLRKDDEERDNIRRYIGGADIFLDCLSSNSKTTSVLQRAHVTE